jgi:ABC-2 type transport system ATP-binding protein
VIVPEPTGRIVVSGLTKSFGQVRAVDDLNFTVEPGSVTAFLGPNGAGKTTTLRMLLGLVTPDRGAATIGGHSYRRLPQPSTTVGAALEATGFHPYRTGRNHLRVYCTINGYPQTRADEVLDLVGLTGAARRVVRGYSLGMRQRLAVAAALLGDPHVLVLDEPANGLDPEGIVWIRGLLRDLAEQGRTVLVSSHVLTEVEQLADHAVIISRGRCAATGPLDELTNRHGGTVTVATPHVHHFTEVVTHTHPHARVEPLDSQRLRVHGIAAADIGDLAFDAQICIHELTTERGDLEQVFFALTADTAQAAAQPVATVQIGG